MKLTILGTGCASVTDCYNTCFVLSDNGQNFMVDGGGGNTIFKQLKSAGINWKSIRHIFITHKHMDHLFGIMWFVRMICQHINRNTYEGEAYIYGHDEVIKIIRDIANLLLLKRELDLIGDKLHLVTVEDGEELDIIGHRVRFLMLGQLRQSSLVLPCITATVKNSPAVVTSLFMNVKGNMCTAVIGFCTRLFVCILRRIFFSRMRKTIPPLQTLANLRKN